LNTEAIEKIVIDLLEEFFNRYAIKYTRHQSYHRWLGHYYNFRLKHIPPSTRKIYISKELGQQLKNHPSKDVLFDLIYKTGAGKDLNAHQSKASFDSAYHDRLFNDWGIHHLHISNTKKEISAYFFDRADHLLFVRFTNEEAFFLKSYPHKERVLWSKRDFIRIIRNNWPWSIADKEMPGLVYPDLNDEEILSLRSKGYLFGVNIDRLYECHQPVAYPSPPISHLPLCVPPAQPTKLFLCRQVMQSQHLNNPC
jgi:hypothetical protein